MNIFYILLYTERLNTVFFKITLNLSKDNLYKFFNFRLHDIYQSRKLQNML